MPGAGLLVVVAIVIFVGRSSLSHCLDNVCIDGLGLCCLSSLVVVFLSFDVAWLSHNGVPDRGEILLEVQFPYPLECLAHQVLVYISSLGEHICCMCVFLARCGLQHVCKCVFIY